MRAILVGVCIPMALCAVLAQAAEGTFGVRMGDKPEQFGCRKNPVDPIGYVCERLPQMHPDLGVYLTQSSPALGICTVRGIAEDVNTNTFGDQLRAKTDELAEQVALRYGAPTKTDELKAGSIWTDERDWISGLRNRDRRYGYLWAGTLPNDLSRVEIFTAVHAGGEAFIVVEFEFSNKAQCDEEQKRMKASAF